MSALHKDEKKTAVQMYHMARTHLYSEGLPITLAAFLTSLQTSSRRVMHRTILPCGVCRCGVWSQYRWCVSGSVCGMRVSECESECECVCVSVCVCGVYGLVLVCLWVSGVWGSAYWSD